MPRTDRDMGYDAIVIGSGAGGAAAAYRLVGAGCRVLLVEKGPRLARDARTLDPQLVVREGAFRSSEAWVDGRGRRLVPEEYFNVGGKTKWYGAALLRFGADEFGADPAFGCRPWPLSAADLDPYYGEIERLLGVRTFDVEPDLARLLRRLTAPDIGFACLALPMGLAATILGDRQEAAHFDGFASVRGYKSDAESSLLAHLADAPGLQLRAGQAAARLLPAAGDPRRVAGVQLADGSEHRARFVVLAAGALHSPRLLEAYVQEHGLRAALPGADQIGRHLKLHLLTAMIALSPRRTTDLLRKTAALLHPDLPHSSVQPLGFDAELIAELVPGLVPRALARAAGRHAYGFFLQTEDASHPDNRVRARDPVHGSPCLDYDPRRSPAGLREHRALVARLRGGLLRAGQLAFSRRIGAAGTAHACGTLAAGADPRFSVVDRDGAVHGLRGLYVADGSVLPRSSRVNPSLTIYAFALRCAERALAREAGTSIRAA